MSVPAERIINVSLVAPPAAIGAPNPNVVAILTSDDGDGVLSTGNRFEVYASAPEVEEAFGTPAAVTKTARTVLSQNRTPVDGGGFLVVGFWRKEDEVVPDQPATLTSYPLETAPVVNALQGVSDGSFAVEVGGVEQTVDDLDFSTVTSISDVVDIIDEGLTDASAIMVGTRIRITTDAEGDAATLTYMTEAAAGTFIGEIVAMAEGTGAELVQGVDEETLPPETKLEALNALVAEVDVAGAMFVDPTDNAEKLDLAAWASDRDILVYDVFTGAAALEVDPANPAWQIRQAGHRNFRMTHSKSGTRQLPAAYMGRMHSMDFAGDSTAITMHLKQLVGLQPESYTTTELNNAQTIGLDLYTSTEGEPILYTSGGNEYSDVRYTLLAYVKQTKIRLLNVLFTTTTKIPQTGPGVDSLIDAGEQMSDRYVGNGTLAPGEWTSPDYFGDKDTFLQAIREDGYYWLAGALEDQPVEDREGRKAPPLRNAVKLAGAIHEADVTVQFNR